METAYYGRLSLGHCVSRDYGFVGCFVDVLDLVAGLCSGRRDCLLPVSRLRHLVRQPCPDDLTVYLDADYLTVNLVQTTSQSTLTPTTSQSTLSRRPHSLP